MGLNNIFSSDAHFTEPPDLWEKRLDKKFADRMPHVVSEDGADWWYADGFRLSSIISGNQAGLRFERQDKMSREGRFADCIPGSYDPLARLKDMDDDGVRGEVLYATLARHFSRFQDSAYLSAVYRAYNDFIAEFCAAAPERIKGVGLINLDEVDDGLRELERVGKLGLSAAMVSCYPAESRPYSHPLYEPFWAAVQDLAMPVSLHGGTNREPPQNRALIDDPKTTLFLTNTPSYSAVNSRWIQLTLGDLVMGGVFERFPGLRVVSVENDIGWAPYLIWKMDQDYTQQARRPGWQRFRSDAVPSDFFRRNVSFSFQADAIGIKLRHEIGVDNLMFGTDYPHPESTFPHSRRILEEVLADVPEDEREKITRSNAAAMYGFDLSG
jgi:predicted TIM-barrel fold metal-dependent hydrolase